ncbi:MAG: HNH endonuclease [Promethearchaeota archaeon]
MAKLSAKTKILNLFQANLNNWIPINDIREVTQISEWARTIRTLRTEGWSIEKRSGSTSTQYRLISLEKQEGVVREPLNQRLRAEILRRDGYRCVHCGRNPEEDNIKLEVDHIIPVEWGGKTEPENLQTLCRECNQGKKDYFSDYDDNDVVKEIIKAESGTKRLLLIGTKLINHPLDVFFIRTLAGIRDWTRLIRALRQDGKIDYKWDSKNKTYTFQKVTRKAS